MASTDIGIDAVPVLPSHTQVESSPTESLNEKRSFDRDVEDASDADKPDTDVDGESTVGVLNDARDIVTHVISVEDDPSLSPWTFRTLVIGLGLSTFGGVLGM
jgi:hypothetical protein